MRRHKVEYVNHWQEDDPETMVQLCISRHEEAYWELKSMDTIVLPAGKVQTVLLFRKGGR